MGTPERLIAHAVRQGFRVTRTKKGYFVHSKDGKTSVLLHLTPSDRRAVKNDTARLRRIGVEIP